MSHSKRNTSRAVFTSHERAMAKASWASSSARLTRESFLPFAACCLCLETARDPVACPAGDIFCRECALSNILAQKKEIKRLGRAREQEEREEAEEQARRDSEAQDRAVKEFELVQAGFDVRASSRGGPGAKKGGRRQSVKADEEPLGEEQETQKGQTQEREPQLMRQESNGEKRGDKRKFELDDEELARIAADERAKARKSIEDEKALKPTLPSFWTPSVTPASNKNNVLHDVKRKTKSTPICPASQENKPHPYSLYTLVSINFTEEDDCQSKQPQRICPSCQKGLTNSSKAMLAKPCGHVLCSSCVDKFMGPAGHVDPHSPGASPSSTHCYVCDADLTEKKADDKHIKGEKEKIRPGLVPLNSEGTGFSASGMNEVKRSGVAFQC